MERAFEEYADPGVCAAAAIDCCLRLAFIELVRCYQEELEAEESLGSREPLTRVLRYLEQHCVDCTLPEVARHFGYHPNYLSRRLKELTGSGFQGLVSEYRLDRAALMLANVDDPIEDVASACGYDNLSFFYRKFRERFSCTPAAYRAQAARGSGDAR